MASLSSRVTELSNELTTEIDKSDSIGVVHLLRQSDAQLFAGYGPYDSIYDSRFLAKMDKLAGKVANLLQENESGSNNIVVFTGCGTSGRIAWSCSCSFNRLLTQQQRASCFRYLIAGGDKALIVGDELPEDDPPRGAHDLAELSEGSSRVLLVGITCGLSAPYVAGQIDYAMEKDNFYPVLIGFNSVDAARDIRIEKWDKTCKETFSKLEELEMTSDGGMIINPIIGPEPITGSSRMKGGSMTAIILNTVFLLAFSRVFSVPLWKLLGSSSLPVPHANSLNSTPPATTMKCNNTGETSDHLGANNHVHEDGHGTAHVLSAGQSAAATVLDAFSANYIAAYRPASGLAALMEAAGASLRHPEGHLYYLGARLFGVVGFIDSSEMVSTFGSSPYEVRGFVEGGWTTCQNSAGDLSKAGDLFCISVSDFERDILPTLSRHDCVLWLHDLPNERRIPSADGRTIHELMDKISKTQACCCLLSLTGYSEGEFVDEMLSDPRFKTKVLIKTPYFNVVGTEALFGSFALKLILNVISTGANILKGRVYENMMINLKVANDKLFYRSVSIVSKLGGVGEKQARQALLRAIYKEEEVEEHAGFQVSQHIKRAVRQNMVVPLALILASRGCSIVEAEAILSSRTAIRDVVKSSV